MKPFKYLAIGLILLTGCNIPPSLTQTATRTSSSTPFGAASTPTFPVQTLQPSPSAIPNSNSTTQSIGQSPIDRSNADRLTKINSIPKENTSRLIWLPDGKSLAVLGFKQFSILSIPNLEIIREINFPEDETILDFDPVAEWLATTIDRNEITIKDLDGTVINTIIPAGGFGSASFAPSGGNIWLTSMEKFEAAAYNIQSGKISLSCGGFETAAPVYRAFPSPKGNWLVWMARATVQLSSIPSCQPGAHIGHEDFVISHAFTNDEETLATSTGGTILGEFQPLILFWDTRTGKQTGTIPLVDMPASGLAFAPNDDVIVSAGSGLTVWDTSSLDEVISLANPGQRFNTVGFSPDGIYLAASDEKSVTLFTVKP